MTDIEKRIKIAKFCGWRLRETKVWEKICLVGLKYITIMPNGKECCGYLPDYLNDLNAIHEAEMMLTNTQRDRIAKILATPFAGPRGSGEWDQGLHEAVFATARQRAEALLKII